MLLFITIFAIACDRRVNISPTKTSTQVINALKTPTITFELPTATIPFVHPTDTSESGEESISLPENPEKIRELLLSSIECQFPCFLGIFPGKTDYKTTIEELSRVATSYTGEGKSFDGKIGYNFKLHYPNNDLDISLDVSTLDKNIVVDLILYPKSTLAKFYSVPQVIDFYRKPDSIFVFTLSEPYGDDVQPFDLILDYSSKGFLLWYRNPDVSRNNEKIELCYRNDIAPTIYLWSPNERRTFLDIAPIGKGESKDAKQIDDPTITDSKNVSELLTAPDGFCVQTDKNNWKDITQYP